MQPAFLILADRTDITRAVADRLLELVVTDEAGLASDTLRLTLDDRRRADGAIAQLPKIGTVLEVSLSYAGRSWVAMGKFIVDEIEISSPPATLAVSAKAADMVGPFRSPKTRSWDATTLGKLVETIASEHRYLAKIDPELGAIEMAHLDQTAESDMALLTRLAAKHDAVAKPVAGFLVLARQGAAKTVTGQVLPTLSLKPEQLAQWRYQHSARKPAGTGSAQGETGLSPPLVSTGGVRAYWWDFEKGERREVTTGQPPFEDIRYVHASEAEAKAAAATRKNTGERGQGELSFSLPGDPRLAAEGRLSISLRPGIPIEWRVKRVEHPRATQPKSSASGSPPHQSQSPTPPMIPTHKEATVPEKDPTTYGLITYLWVMGLSAWGGLVNFYRKVKTGETRSFNFIELIGELATSAFAGLITFWLCEAAQFNPLITAALVGISGHMGSQAIYQLERWAQTRLDNASNKERP